MNNENYRNNKMTEGAHLLILVSFTVTACILFGEILIRGWDKSTIPIIIGLVVYSWSIYLLQKYNTVVRVYLYAVFMMICYFIYGIHQTSLTILPLSMVVIILIFYIARVQAIIWCAEFTYLFTVLLNIVKEGSDWKENYNITLEEAFLQYFLVLLAGFVASTFIIERKKEQELRLHEEAEMETNEDYAREQIRVIAKELGKYARDIEGDLLIFRDALTKGQSIEDINSKLSAIHTKSLEFETELTDLKDFSDLLSGKSENHEEGYEVLDLMSQLRNIRHIFNDENDVDLIIDLDPMVPKAMVGDWDKILKIMRHLINNGLRFTKNGGVQVKIYTYSHAGDFNLCIEINDTGIGMERTALERLLEQINDRKTAMYRPGGLGLGLFLVTGFVEKMGGFFRMESEWGKGTTVCVSIPQRVTDAAPCMSFDNKAEICLAYEDYEYFYGRLNDFYEDLFRNFSEKIGIPAYAVKNKEELSELVHAYKKVCLLVDSSFYEKKTEYYESLDEIYVLVLCNVGYVLPEDSHVHLLYKPIESLDILYNIEWAKKTIDRRRRDDNFEISDSQIHIHAESLKERDIRQRGGREIMIVTDSMSDLSQETSKKRGIPIIPFRVYTEQASFLDGLELSQECALDYLKRNCRKNSIYSMAPEENEFKLFFEENLRYAKHLIYICSSKGVSVAYNRAKKAAENMNNVTVINSGQISGGVALMAVAADEMVKEGKSMPEILSYLSVLRSKIKTSFLIENLDYMIYIGKVSKGVGRLARALMFHPVIVMKRDVLTIGGAKFGNLNSSKKSYIQKILKNKNKIDTSKVFVGYVGLKERELAGLEYALKTEGGFEDIVLRRASAAISINCGVGTFGIIYIQK
ncbi:MAG: HAMP domain-containing histidine kinase [Butyrivibrio sp.]|nr:HAMP domain-containing histidine kinase [Butyrivibrio sp.]